MDPIRTFTSVVDLIKKARDVAKRLKDVEVQEILLDAQERALSLQEELLTIRAENTALKEKLSAKHHVTFDGQVYWSGEPGNPANGPFCATCKDKDDKLVRMADRGNGYTCCVVCGTCVENKKLPYPGLRLSPTHDVRPQDVKLVAVCCEVVERFGPVVQRVGG